eukprot:10365219-Karenia_brevis.AAC.1
MNEFINKLATPPPLPLLDKKDAEMAGSVAETDQKDAKMAMFDKEGRQCGDRRELCYHYTQQFLRGNCFE